jgi:hypothetical protein
MEFLLAGQFSMGARILPSSDGGGTAYGPPKREPSGIQPSISF